MMKATQVIEYFGSGAEAARRLGVTRQALWNWKARRDRVPELYARRAHELTHGRLKFDKTAYLDS